MQILVTGGSGSLGSAICKKMPPDIPVLFNGDIRDPDSFHYDSFDAVVHAAAAKNNKSETDIMSVNVNGTRSLLDYCVGRDLQFIHLISSSEVYNSNIYGVSKFQMENMAKSYNLPICCLRLPTIWGSNSSLLDIWISKARNGLPIDLFYFGCHTKKKFFITIDRAAEYCLQKQNGMTAHPICDVFDAKVLAEVISDKFRVEINKVYMDGSHFEFLDDDYCSKDFDAISHNETKNYLEELYPLP